MKNCESLDGSCPSDLRMRLQSMEGFTQRISSGVRKIEVWIEIKMQSTIAEGAQVYRKSRIFRSGSTNTSRQKRPKKSKPNCQLRYLMLGVQESGFKKNQFRHLYAKWRRTQKLNQTKIWRFLNPMCIISSCMNSPGIKKLISYFSPPCSGWQIVERTKFSCIF